MKRSYIITLFSGAVLLLGLLLFPAHKWARAHVNYVTATEDHPLLCSSCHVYTQNKGLISKLINADYYSPFNMAVSGDGSLLCIVAQEGNALLVADPLTKKVLHRIRVGNHPHTVIIDRQGKLAYVSNQWSDNVSVIDLDKFTVTDTIPTGNGPAGLSLSSDGMYLYVVNSFGSDLSVIELKSKEEEKRLSLGNNPTGIELSPGGKVICVTSRRALIAPYGDTLKTELTVADDSLRRISEHKSIESAYLMENVAFTPSGDLALVTLIRPKNMLPSIQIESGWMMTNGIGIIEQKEHGRTIQLLLDEPNSYYADPFDIVIAPDGKRAYVSSSGVDCISVIDMDSLRSLMNESTSELLRSYSNNLGISSRFVIKRIHTGPDPKGLALSPDGKLLYVAEQLNDRIAIINTNTLELENSIELGGPRRITVARRGKRLFNNAGHTFQNQYSCYTCHPDVHEDGLVYNMASKDMGRNMTNTQSLREIGDTPPYKWNGKNQTIYKQDGMRFSTVLTRTEQFSYKDLDALVAFIVTGVDYPPNLQYNPAGELTESQLRGKAVFERRVSNSGKAIPYMNRCITCHPPPYYTNLRMADVGTLASTDDPMLFDTPHLNNVYASAPYLHDGRAVTLEEIWTKYGKEDKHGMANDLTKNQLNDLVDYLMSLSGPEYNHQGSEINHASLTSN